jgi:hypothetical protein
MSVLDGDDSARGWEVVTGDLDDLLSLGRFSTEEFARLWLIATATYVVGDSVTTMAIIRYSRTIAEGNAAMAAAVESFGEAGLIGLKLAAMLFGLAVSIYATREHDRILYYTPPAFLAVVGAFATAYNIRLLLG